MTDELKIPWVEKYRPTELDALIIPVSLKKKVQSWMDKGQDTMPNMLFEGPPGTGKTTLAKIIAEKLGMTYMYLNASDESGIDTVRTKMKAFCSTMTIDGSLKLVICDEADRLTGPAQDSLRNLIEEVHKTSRFVFTCNYPERITPALKSRLKEVYFESVEEPLITKRAYEVLKAEHVNVTKEEFEKMKVLVHKHYPDIRKVINHLQYFSSTGTLEIDFSELQAEDIFVGFITAVKAKKLSAIREILRNNKLDVDGVIKRVFQCVLNDTDEFKELNEGQKAEIVVTCAQFMRQSMNDVIDKEINFADFSVQLMQILARK